MKANLVSLAALAMLTVLALLWWNAEQQNQAATRQIASLKEQLAAAQQAKGPAPSAAESEPAEVQSAPALATAKPAGVEMGPYLRMIDELRARVGQLEKDLAEAQTEAGQQRSKALEESERAEKAAVQIAALREEAAQQRRLAEVYEAELKSKTQRMTTAETAEKVLQERLTQAEQAARRNLTLSREVEDLSRRREAIITTLERRYREVTDLYRNHALSAQNREGATPGMQSGDLSRIQSALNQAEDDLRQLRSLNGRLAEIERAARK